MFSGDVFAGVSKGVRGRVFGVVLERVLGGVFGVYFGISWVCLEDGVFGSCP